MLSNPKMDLACEAITFSYSKVAEADNNLGGSLSELLLLFSDEILIFSRYFCNSNSSIRSSEVPAEKEIIDGWDRRHHHHRQ